MHFGLHYHILPFWKELRMDTKVLLYYCFLNWQDPINLLKRVKLTLTAYPSSDCHVCFNLSINYVHQKDLLFFIQFFRVNLQYMQ